MSDMKAAASRLQMRAIISPQNRRVFDPRIISASLRPFDAATIGEVRDSPCQMKVNVSATRPLAPRMEVPNPEMMK